jgi:hypothetical protein
MHALMLSYSLSGAAGLRAPLTLLIVSIAVHFGYIHPNSAMAWVGAPWVIGLAGAVTLVDFLGDKIPGVDHALHAVHTVLAPVMGAIAAMTSYNGDPSLAAIPAVLGAGNALLVHAARSSARVATTGATAGMGNTAVSFAEDGVAGIYLVVAFVAPVLAAVVLVLFTVWAIRLVRRLFARRAAGGPVP